MSRSSSRLVSGLTGLLVLVFAWWLLAPTQLGGKTSYAVIYGISMEPHFHQGDLVVLRRQSHYQVGEIVGYHSRQLGRPVMHRIVAINGNRYAFKGDNNSFRDPEHPVATQLFGREWVRLPGFGSTLESLRQPRNAALLAGAAMLFLLLGGSTTARRRRRRRTSSDLRTRPAVGAPPSPITPPQPSLGRPISPSPPSKVLPAFALVVAGVGLIAAAASTAVALAAYTRPLEQVTTESNLYIEKGTFAYSAPAKLGATYDHAPLKAGDPLFLKLVHRMNVSFAYSVRTKEQATLQGQTSLDAFLGDGQGWKRRLELQPVESFHGQHAAVTGAINLDGLWRMIGSFEKETGEHNIAYVLDVIPRVQLLGNIGPQGVSDLFTPSLRFTVAQNSVRLAAPGDGGGGGSSNSLTRSKSGGVGEKHTPRDLGILPVGVAQARHFATVAIPIAVLLMLLGGALFVLVRGNDEVSAIRRRYGAWMVDVAPGSRPPQAERRVESIDALARIAERYERLILHEQRDKLHSYVVEDDGLVYRYDTYEKQAWRVGQRRESAVAEPVATPGAAAATGQQTEPTP